ncbi:hypothetical protein CEV31_3236 [Brucella thiophenivorans]|uniref:Uncharacterized protein n=1 Tax=Brucella thiophenivorans TaxID=571255 RepID=A0A256FKB6_9HYPH|nr:hypothetical protein CEV31_3236 [Brucella thiophenivorans]
MFERDAILKIFKVMSKLRYKASNWQSPQALWIKSDKFFRVCSKTNE